MQGVTLFRKCIARTVTRFLLFYCLLLFSTSAFARCYEQAAARYGVNADLLRAIARVESSENPNAVNVNRGFKQHNEDIGLMQINSIWLPQLARYGITREHLFDPCLSVQVGAWILAQQIYKYGNTWRAVGAYHSATPELNARYAQRIHAQLKRSGAID